MPQNLLLDSGIKKRGGGCWEREMGEKEIEEKGLGVVHKLTKRKQIDK